MPAGDLASVACGETVYRRSSKSRHGVELEGEPDRRTRDADALLPAPPHDATGHTWHHADELLSEIVKHGAGAVIGDETCRSAMPACEAVPADTDSVAALACVERSRPPGQRRWQAEVDGAGGALRGTARAVGENPGEASPVADTSPHRPSLSRHPGESS